MSEFRLFYDSGDPWGSTMGWWFAVAGEMNERGLDIPSAWQYRPGLGGGDRGGPDRLRSWSAPLISNLMEGKMTLKLTPDLVRAAAYDAAMRSMRKAGRTVWSEEDYNLACEVFERLYGYTGESNVDSK